MIRTLITKLPSSRILSTNGISIAENTVIRNVRTEKQVKNSVSHKYDRYKSKDEELLNRDKLTKTAALNSAFDNRSPEISHDDMNSTQEGLNTRAIVDNTYSTKEEHTMNKRVADQYFATAAPKKMRHFKQPKSKVKSHFLKNVQKN
jgi:hypothetical protein